MDRVLHEQLAAPEGMQIPGKTTMQIASEQTAIWLLLQVMLHPGLPEAEQLGPVPPPPVFLSSAVLDSGKSPSLPSSMVPPQPETPTIMRPTTATFQVPRMCSSLWEAPMSNRRTEHVVPVLRDLASSPRVRHVTDFEHVLSAGAQMASTPLRI